jgi:hypothetical protein
MTIQTPGTDTPGIFDHDLHTLAVAVKITEAALSPEARAELLTEEQASTRARSIGADWAALVGLTSCNTRELLRIIEHLADQVTKERDRAEDLRGQLLAKSTEAGQLRAKLHTAGIAS